jgi:hypothetical protein
MDKRKTIMKSKDGSKELFVENNTIGINLDEHTKASIDLAKAGQMAGEWLANVNYEKVIKKIKNGGKWLKFAGFLSKFKRK